MLSCKKYNYGDYRVSINPHGGRIKYKLPTTPAPSVFSEFATSSTYYWLPYYNGIAIDLVLKAENTSDKPLVALEYKWKWFYRDKTEHIFVTSGDGILMGGLENRVLSSDFRIPFEHIPQHGQYEVQVQIMQGNEVILPLSTMATINISQWNKFVFWILCTVVGGVGVVLGVLLQKFIN